MLGDLARCQCCPRQFDHRADFVFNLHPMLAHHLPRDFMNQLGLLRQLFADRDQRDHDFESYLLALSLDLDRGFENCAALHARDLRKQQSQPAATEAKHRICFANLVHMVQQLTLFVDLIEKMIHIRQRVRLSQGHL